MSSNFYMLGNTKVGKGVYSLAQGDSQTTGLNTDVILSQWDAEEGSAGVLKSTSDWSNFNNNPAGMTAYNQPTQILQLSNGTSPNGFLEFPSAQAGAEAYGLMIKDESNYSGIRQAAKSHNAKKELMAIANSPWDSNHYKGNTNTVGYNLLNAYDQLKYGAGLNVKDPKGLSGVGSEIGQAAGSYANTVTGGGSNLLKWFGFKSLTSNKAITDYIVIGGIVLGIVLVYKLFTH